VPGKNLNKLTTVDLGIVNEFHIRGRKATMELGKKMNLSAFARKATTSSFEGRYVGRIYKTVSHAPREAPWYWGLEFHEWHGSDGPQYGKLASLGAAKQALCVAWDRRPKASGKS
jgi:hypothetical protein